jgi:hypothetical protein
LRNFLGLCFVFAELSLLNEEHEVLQLRSDVLQGAVACREDHVSTHLF